MIDDNSKEFIKRHIGPSEEEQSKMLKYIGYKSLQDLMESTVPEKILLKENLKIDQPMSENDALKKLKSISKKKKIAYIKIRIKSNFINIFRMNT
jgi:glycine dehydrogenase